MDRLSIFLSLMTGTFLSGVLLIAAFTLGWFTWTAILASAAIGFALAWPTGYVISRRIKRNAPGRPRRADDARKA